VFLRQLGRGIFVRHVSSIWFSGCQFDFDCLGAFSGPWTGTQRTEEVARSKQRIEEQRKRSPKIRKSLKPLGIAQVKLESYLNRICPK